MTKTRSPAHPKPAMKPTCLLLDIGGVLLTDGWDHHARRRASKKFDLKWAEFEPRHRAVFETFEQGHLTIDEYLDLVVFHSPRKFTRSEFRRFMFAQSKPFPKMIELVKSLKRDFNLKIIVLSNEAREINAFRIREFGLAKFVDAFISSCFVNARKPDNKIFRMALDIAQVPIRNIIYLENTQLFVEVAESLGIASLLHTDYSSTLLKFSALGLSVDKMSKRVSFKKLSPLS